MTKEVQTMLVPKGLINKGLPKLIEQGILVIFLITVVYFLRQERNSTQGEYIQYLKEDNKRMIEVIERNTAAFENCVGRNKDRKPDS